MGEPALVMLLIAVNECLTKSKLREKGFTLAPSLRMQSIMIRKAWWQEFEAAGHIVSKSGSSNECWRLGHIVSKVRMSIGTHLVFYLFFFLFLTQSRPQPTHGATHISGGSSCLT